MTQQYMAGYPPVQTAPGTAFPDGSRSRSGSHSSPQNAYNYPPAPPVQDYAVHSGPSSRNASYSQPSFDPYAQQPMAGQLTPYNPPAPVAANGTLLPPPVAPDGTLLPPAPISPDGTALAPYRPRSYSSSSKRSHHSSRSHRSSRSAQSRREAEIERRPSWADSIIALWGAVRGAWDKRTV